MSPDKADSSRYQPPDFDSRLVVKCTRLDSIFEKTDAKIDWLKLEAEEAELEILQEAEKLLGKIKYISADLGFEKGVEQDSTFPEAKFSHCHRLQIRSL